MRPFPTTTRSSPKCSLSKNMAGRDRASNASRVLELPVAPDLDAEFFDQPLGRIAIGVRRGNAHRAAVADVCAPAVGELVALGVATEVVVVVEDEDLLIIAEGSSPEVCGRKPRDAAADDDQVVVLARVDVEGGNCR